jgi:hypothetical protein
MSDDHTDVSAPTRKTSTNTSDQEVIADSADALSTEPTIGGDDPSLFNVLSGGGNTVADDSLGRILLDDLGAWLDGPCFGLLEREKLGNWCKRPVTIQRYETD